SNPRPLECDSMAGGANVRDCHQLPGEVTIATLWSGKWRKVAESRGTGEQPQKSPRLDSLILRPSYSAHESCPAHHFDARVPGQAARPRGEAEAHIFLGARRGVGRARPGGASVCWCNRGRP